MVIPLSRFELKHVESDAFSEHVRHSRTGSLFYAVWYLKVGLKTAYLQINYQWKIVEIVKVLFFVMFDQCCEFSSNCTVIIVNCR